MQQADEKHVAPKFEWHTLEHVRDTSTTVQQDHVDFLLTVLSKRVEALEAAISTLSIEVGRLRKGISSEDASDDDNDQGPAATEASADAKDLED